MGYSQQVITFCFQNQNKIELISQFLYQFRIYLHLQVFGSAGVIGNPMGFARRLGIGIRDFLSVPAQSILQVFFLFFFFFSFLEFASLVDTLKTGCFI